MQYKVFCLQQGQLSTQTTGQASRTSTVTDNLDISGPTKIQAEPTSTSTTKSSIHKSQTPQVSSPSTTESNGHATNETIETSASRHANSSGTDGVFTDKSTSNSSNQELQTTADGDEYYYTAQRELAEKDLQQIGVSTGNNETDNSGGHDMSEIGEKAENESIALRELFDTDETVLNINGSEEVSNSSLTAVTNDSTVVNSSQSQVWMSRTGTTSTARPISTAWLLGELPSDSHWTNKVHSSGEYVPAHRESAPAAHAPSTFSARLGPRWKLFQRLTRPTRLSGYRQMLASPFIAGGGAMNERERKRALLHAYLLAGIAGKDLSHRRAMSTAVFYRSKLAKPSETQHEVGGPPKQADDAEISSWNSRSLDVTANPQDSNRADVTTGCTDSLDSDSLAWDPNSSVSMNYSSVNWMSVDNETSNVTFNEGQVSAQLYRTSSGHAAAAAIVIPIIVGFLESLTRKQFSWLDMTLAVCGTIAIVLGLINLIVFVAHLVRTKRGKLNFHAERQRSDGLMSSPLSSSMPVTRLSPDSIPPPPPPPPPLPLVGFGGLSKSSREVSRDVLADDETLRIRPLTFKRPLTDWGFTNSHALTGTTEVAVARQAGGVTVKSNGSDASSSGIESNGGRSDESTRMTRENGASVPVGSSVITNYAYCGNGAVNRGIIIDVDDYRDRTCTSPSDFVFGKNYGQSLLYYIRRYGTWWRENLQNDNRKATIDKRHLRTGQ